MKGLCYRYSGKERNLFLKLIIKKFLIIVEKTYEALIQRNRSYTSTRLVPFETIRKEF